MIVRKIAPKLAQKRVAAYARVSTLTESQEESYETQVAYYENLIGGTEGWELAGIYADKGITGTSATKRPEFLRLIEDARKGKGRRRPLKKRSKFESKNRTTARRLNIELLLTQS